VQEIFLTALSSHISTYIQNTTDFLPLLLFFHKDPAVAGVFAVHDMPSTAVVPCLKLAFLLLLGSLQLPTSLLGCVLTERLNNITYGTV
jgi:hypothetical protein